MLKNNQISNAQKPSLLTIGLNFYVSLSLLLGTAPALANEPSIIADPGASNRPDILKAPNETLIINITNPDSKGVSINEYSRFNTPTTGTILNNSNKNIDTKIAGQIDANYRLNKEASLIINKVNSAEKSSLKGNLEVAGSRADVVIANPNGISVDGLNMINSRSLTLTTGNINKLSPKEIELISNNSIDIVGDGLNDKSSDYTNVISNAINLNSNIHANELNIIGEKALTSSKDRLYNDVKAKNQENSFSLDSSALGGMYANKIKLVGTSNGVGVNNNGLVIANNNIEISLDGDIVNTGAIASNKDTSIKANTITNKDEALIAAKENLNIKADTLVNTSSQIYAKDINVEAKKLVNNSSSQARVDTVHKQGTMHLKKEGVNRYKLGVNLKELKEKISTKLAKKLGKDISELDENEVNELVLKEAANKDGALYALNLHKDSYLYGTSQKIFHNLRLDYDTNEVLVDTSRAKSNEQKRTITYSIVKDVLNEDDKANFIPGSIIANNDINLNVNDVLNDKSVIYAGGDLKLNSDNVENIALMLNNNVNSYSVYKWKEKKKWYRRGFKSKWETKGGKSTNFNFSYTDVGLPAVFAAGNNIVGSTQDFSSYALNDDIKLANVDLDKFSEPIFNSPIIKNLNRRVKNQGYYYSLDSINSAYIANILDGLYEARNESISKFKNEAKDKNVKASALVMANNIDLDAKGNISLAGSVVADNINLNSQNLNLNHLELNSKDLNLKAGAANINSSEISAKNINVNANNISLDKESSQFSKASNLKADESLNLNAKENLNIAGGGLEADKINLNADNININAKEFAYSHSAKEKGVEFSQSIQTLNSANLDAKDINLNSKSNTQISSSNLRATNKLNIEAGNDIYVVGANTNESTETKEKSKGFFSKKESHLMAINQKVISSNLNAGDISLKAGSNAIVTGSNLSAKNDIDIDANNIGLAPTAYKNDEARSSSKKSFGGLKSSLDMHSLAKTNLQGSSLSTSQGDINLNANNDISIISSDIKGGRNVNLNAGNNLSILAAKEQIKEKSVHKSSNINIISLLTYPGMLVASAIDPIGTGSNTYLFEQMFGDTLTQIYRSTYNEKGSLDALAKLSNISAAKELNLKANEATITANLSSKDDTNIKANSIEISNAENEHSSYEISKSKGINLPSTKDLANDQKPKPIKEFKYDTSTKTRVADAEYKKSTTDVASTKAISSNLISDKNINLNANEEIGITGSNLIAKEDINLISKNANIDILNSTDTTDISKTLKQAKAALSITAQNEYVEVAPASLALIEAIKQLKKVKKEYDNYKHTRDDLKDKLHELKQAYKSKTPGIDGSDIEDLSDILENVNDEERYYKANIALAMANVEAKSLALVAQVAAAAKAASNWYTFGFSVGVAASVNGHKSKSNSNEVVSNPSNLSANNIKIQTPNDTTITGSNLSANNLIDINTNNLNINSSKNTYTSESKDKSIGGTMRYTMYGGGGGSAGLNYSTSSSDTESLTNNNSHLYSAKDMNINTANDATIKGANLRADERLNLKVGNNLNLESVRDKYAYNERGYSVGVGIGFSSDKSPNSSFANPSSTKATSTNANFSRSSSNTITKQTVLSSITANELNVEVGKNTHLKGSLLAAGEYDKDNTFIDNHNLNLKTNTLSYENLSNTSYAKGTNFSIGANYILEDKNNKDSRSNNNQEDKFTGLKSIDLSNHRNLSYSLSKNLATLGSGNIEIADKENSDDLTRLNRDTTKLTKDLVNTSISSNVDASMDLRVVTKSGQKDIKDEFNTATAITKALNAIIKTGEFNFNSEVKENVAQYEAGKLLGKELAQKLTDDSVTIEEKEALGNKFIQLFASMSGLDLDGISLRIIDDKFAKGKDDEKFLGHFNSGSIILNLAHIKNVDQFVSTLGHELKHAMDYKAGRFIPGDSKQDRYAKLKEDSFSDYLSKALNLQDSGINAKDAAIKYIKNQSSLNTLLLNSYMFNGLDKSKGDNRQFSQPEIDWLKANGNNFANFIRERTGIDISQDEAISRLSVQALKQSDNVWSLMFNKDDALAKEFLTKSDNKEGLFVVDKFDNRNNRLNLDVAINNIDFYNKYIHPNIDSLPLETVKNSILNLASNADKIPSNLQNWYKDQTFTASSLRDGAISLAKDITVNGVSGVRNMYYNIFNNDKKILEKVYDYNGISDDIALISGFDTSSLTGVAAIGKGAGVGLGKGAVGLGKLAKDGVVAVGKASVNGASKIANQIETNALNKITQNLPKNAMYNKTNGIISIENKNFIQVGTDTLTNSPILREIGYNKGNYALKGNHYVSTADGLYMIGKNALQKTGTKVVTNSNLAEFMKPGVNPISDMYYNGTNFAIRNSTKITDFINGYFIPGTPDYVFWGGVGALTNMGINYDTTIENFKNSYDAVKNSIIDFKNENFK
ncbi:hemagglutinin repeat-containing protein [Campylobacter concisus]|uniref:hemagglutinin repeat-containing protein n=3 Tax=Campylobacter concisus TaxID=199 RepID=UPI0011E7D9E3|nr:hemagglutinin repeat-containing protein [Campylobacter concisus]